LIIEFLLLISFGFWLGLANNQAKAKTKVQIAIGIMKPKLYYVKSIAKNP
jgi:hypothetical protein